MNKTVNRIPFEYFITSGCGSSDLEIHAGSYHMALFDANISDYNIQTYSSVLPAIANEINQEDVIIPFGSELYTIMSCIHGKKNEHIACGIIFGELFDQDKKIGSLVCEVSGDYLISDLITKLNNVIEDLHKRTYSQYEMKNIKNIVKDYIPQQKFGTCLVSLCFYSFQ